MNQKNKGKAFENYVAFIYEQLLMLDNENSTLKKDFILKKENESFQIDVYYEFTKANIKHRVAIECKNWEKLVDRKEVAYFDSYINHLRNITGVIVSKLGFTRGAHEYANSKGIILLTLEDLPNFINAIGLNLEKVYLADKDDIAEPFYTILWVDNKGNWTGDYLLEDYRYIKKVMPLFISKKHAEDFLKLRKNKNLDVRPLKRGHINFIVELSLKKMGGFEELKFALILFPFAILKRKSITLNAKELKYEYLL